MFLLSVNWNVCFAAPTDLGSNDDGEEEEDEDEDSEDDEEELIPIKPANKKMRNW